MQLAVTSTAKHHKKMFDPRQVHDRRPQRAVVGRDAPVRRQRPDLAFTRSRKRHRCSLQRSAGVSCTCGELVNLIQKVFKLL